LFITDIIDSISSALTSGQSVLMPTLPPTRALDLLILLDGAFTTTPALHPFPIFYLAHTSQKAVNATRTMLEWLSQEISLQDHPLDFKSVKIVSQYPDLLQGPPGPRVVVVDNLDLAPGSFAHQAFLDFKSGGNLLLLTSHSITKDTITDKLLSQWEATSPSLTEDTTPRPIVGVNMSTEITVETRIPLQGEELTQWRKEDRMSKEQKDTDLFFEERARNLLEGTESDSDEEEEDQLLLDSTLEPSTTRIRGSAILLQDGTYDFWLNDVIGAGRAGLKHFPIIDRRKKLDDFGVAVKPGEFIRIEDEGFVPVSTVKGREVGGGKRKWDEVEMDVEEIPARVDSQRVEIEINVKIGYVDLEGLHDGRAAGNLLPRLNARKMVIFHKVNGVPDM